MKNIITILILLISISGFAQIEKYAGTYEKKEKRPTGEVLEVVLELKSDGTFQCTFYQDQLDYEDDDKGKGKWIVKNGEILFSAEQGIDVNTEYTMNFDGTKAKIDGDKLIFKESKMVWPPRVPLSKKK